MMPSDEDMTAHLEKFNIPTKVVEKLIKETFAECDADGNGTIDRKELGTVLSQIAKKMLPDAPQQSSQEQDKAIDEAMRDLDKDGNGCLDIDEFSSLIKMFLIMRKYMQEQDDME